MYKTILFMYLCMPTILDSWVCLEASGDALADIRDFTARLLGCSYGSWSFLWPSHNCGNAYLVGGWAAPLKNMSQLANWGD